MTNKLLILKEYLTSSFWFLPSILILGAIMLSEGTLFLDRTIQITDETPFFSFLQWSVEGYRTLLWTMSSSMISVVGIVFSVTLIALSLASNQYGTRVLRNFMSNKLNQFVLGSYIALFVYCLLVLRVVKAEKFISYSVDISVFVALLLALVNMFLLIIYIHHIAKSIQAETLIQGIYKELEEVTHTIYPHTRWDTHSPNSTQSGAVFQQEIQHYPQISHIECSKNGYIQGIDTPALIQLWQKYDIVLWIQSMTWDFVLHRSRLCVIHSKKPLDQNILEEIRSCISLGNTRSASNDIRFSLSQLVEIAVRALSPWINDPVTAITCLNRIACMLGLLTQKNIPGKYYYDDETRIRVVEPSLDFWEILDIWFLDIRHYAQNSPEVLRHIDDLVQKLLPLAPEWNIRESLITFQKWSNS